MSYPETFIRCRLRAVHPFDDLADEIGLALDRVDGREPLRVTLPRADALLMMDQLRAYLAADGHGSFTNSHSDNSSGNAHSDGSTPLEGKNVAPSTRSSSAA